MYTDAETSTGFGAVLTNAWFFGPWGPKSRKLPIVWQEMYVIVAATSLWVEQLLHRSILFLCDNAAVVFILNKQSTKDESLMALVRRLVLLCMRHNILFRAKHVPGQLNVLADRLSRFQVAEFKKQASRINWTVDVEAQELPKNLRPDAMLESTS